MSATLSGKSNFEIKHPFPLLKQSKPRFRNLREGSAAFYYTE